MPSATENRFRQEYHDDIARTGRMGAALSERFQSGLTEFSPQMAFERRLQTAHDQFRERLGRDVETLRGDQVRMGRLDTGFAVGDEDRLFEASARDLNQLTGQYAFQTAGLELDALGLMGSHADRLSERAMSARGGEYHTRRAQRMQDRSEKRDFWGNILGGLITAGGTVAGALVGGPPGAAAGAAAGSAAGNAIRGRRRRPSGYTGGE